MKNHVQYILKPWLPISIYSMFCLQSLQDISSRVTPLVGRWKGHSVTKRSGVYGATIAEADTITLLEMDDRGHLIQVCDYNANPSL